MISYLFQGQVTLLGSSLVGSNQYNCLFSFQDFAGKYTGLDLSVGDYIYLNTENFELGTFTRYEVKSISSSTAYDFSITIEGLVDPSFGLGFPGIAASVTEKLTLNTGSFEALDDRLIAFVYNDNFAKLDNETYPYELTNDPTGFAGNNSVISVTYDGDARTVTLSGANIIALLKGKIVPELTNGWVSPPHATGNGSFFLSWTGAGPTWSTSGFDVKNILIAMVFRDGVNVCLREVHGLMNWETHLHLHETIGTYLVGGGDTFDFVLNSSVATNRRPQINQTTVRDEDLLTTIPSLTTKSYSQLSLSGSSDSNIIVDQTEIVRLVSGIPQVNTFDGTNWGWTPLSSGNFMAVWVMAVPVTADEECQKVRYMLIQAQSQQATSALAGALTPANINLGQISGALPEYVYVSKIIIRRTGSKWNITAVEKLTGTRYNQTAAPSGNFLSTVAVDNVTITGDGTSSNALSVNLENISTIYEQAVPALVWGPIPNPTGRLCQVTVVDSAGSLFLAAVNHASDFSTFTINLGTAFAGKAVIT